jgi:hypothetical protein
VLSLLASPPLCKDDEITVHNVLYAAGNVTWTLGHNAYSHLAWAEFQAMFHLGQALDPTNLKRGHGKVTAITVA